MTREELINSKEYKVVNAAFDWIEEHQDADLLDAFEAGDEWGNKQAVEKACQWLDENMEDYTEYYDFDTEDYDDKDNLHFAVASNYDYKKDFIESFRKAIEQ